MIRKKSKFVFKVKGFHARVPLLIMGKNLIILAEIFFHNFMSLSKTYELVLNSS